MKPALSGKTRVAGVVGAPVTHSLSPLIHNAWLAAAGIDGVYVAFSPPKDRFTVFAEGLRGGAVRGLNVTVPFKEEALALADEACAAATAAGAANLLLFEPDGRILADNTDGVGLFAALAEQAPDWRPGPVVVLGAGGAARGASASLIAAGAADLRIVNRTQARTEALINQLIAAPGATEGSLGGLFPAVRILAFRPDAEAAAFADASLIVNATTLGLGGGPGPQARFDLAAPNAVAMDMVYRPLRTEFLQRAEAAGLATVDGIAMLTGQAAPSFRAFFGVDPPAIDVRGLCLAALEAGS